MFSDFDFDFDFDFGTDTAKGLVQLNAEMVQAAVKPCSYCDSLAVDLGLEKMLESYPPSPMTSSLNSTGRSHGVSSS